MEDSSELGPDKSLLIVDDDRLFLQRLARAMESRGFTVATAETIASAKPVATAAETVLTTAFREWIEAVFAETVPLVAPPAATSSVKTHET